MAGASAAGRPAEILHWPDDGARRRELIRAGVPRLLLLDAGVVPPAAEDGLEDWLWTPTDERDLFARLRRLADRARDDRWLEPGEVRVDDEGGLSFAGHRLPLPPAEAGIARALAEVPGRVRSRAALAEAAWGDVPHRAHSLDSRIFTLRARLAPLGLGIHSVRGRGFLLAPAAGRCRA